MSSTNSKSENVRWHAGHVSREDRRRVLRQSGCTIWFTGLPASGKSTVAFAVERRLIEAGHAAYVLDGDNIRHGLCGNLGFSAEDRAENIRRIGEVARLFADAGVITLTSFVSPYRADRAVVRSLHEAATMPFFEVFVDTPVATCEGRDPKGLYKRARAGEITNFTGVNDPYESPETPELALKTTEMPADACAEAVMALLRREGVLETGD